MINLSNKAPTPKRFELVLNIKDSQGQPTNHHKSVATDSPAKLAYFWYKYNPPQKRFKKKRLKAKTSSLPSAQEADKILKDLYKKEEE